MSNILEMDLLCQLDLRCDALRDLVWYHLQKLKNVENTHGGVLVLACNFTKTNTPPWVFLTFFKIVQMIPNRGKHHRCLTRFRICSMPFALNSIDKEFRC